MKTKSKILLLVMCAVMLVAGTMVGTLAYLTDTEAVANTFAVGKVGLLLTEAVINSETGKAVIPEERTDEGNTEILLIPGRVVDKDPTVTIDGGSERAYVRMMVTVSYDEGADEVFAANGYADWFDFHKDWGSGKLVSTTKENGKINRSYEFRYKDVVAKATTNTELPALFTTVTVPNALTNEQLATMKNLSIDVAAHAIQAEGFDNADQAWNAFAGKN